MQLLSTLFLTLLIFLYGGDSIAATTQASSAPRSGLCASPVNSSSISRTTRSGYDVEGRMTSSTDAAGTTTYTLYDALGRATATLLPDATMPATVLTEVAAIAAAPELADNPRTLTTYDADGRATATTDPLGNTTTFTYDAAARRTSRSVEGSTGVSPVSLTLETTTYDPAGRQTTSTDAKGTVTTFTYDTAGRQTSRSVGVSPTSPETITTSQTYDLLGRRITTTDAEGNLTQFAYDPQGRLIAVTDALGAVTRYAYDQRGLQIAQTDALNRVTTYEYDLMGRRTARILPQGQREEMTYNTLGQLTAHKDFNGQIIARTYDSTTSELLSIAAPSNHPSLSLNHAPARYDFTYDLLGRRTAATAKNKLGTVLSNETFSYDLRSQLTGYAGTTGTIGYGYDPAGNLAGAKSSTPGGYDVSYDYDAQNRITMVHRGQEGIDPNATQLAAYNYDANGNLNGTGYANGVQHAYTYNSLNRLTNLNVARSVGVSPTSLQGYSYTLNKNGHRTQITELSGRTINNTFDKLHRLTREAITLQSGRDILSLPSPTAGTLSYIYDPVGNRTSRTTTGPVATIIPNQTQSFTVNDRLTTDTYDANGNTTESRSVGVSPTSSSDIYSFDNKLIRRTTPDGKTIDLTYNPDGHRLSKFITQNALTQRLVHYLTDANNPTGYAQVIEEKDPLEAAGSQLKKVNLYGHDLISTESKGVGVSPTSSIFYSHDGLGSVRSITNESGDLQETYDYDAYGTLIGLNKRNPTTGLLDPTLLTNPANKPTSEFLFTGEQLDEDLGMYFLRARYLNTNTGRFHTQDNYEGRNGEPLTLHKYLYCGGNPVMFTDPSGKMTLGETSMVVGSLVSLTTIGNVANFFGFLNAVKNDSDQVPDAAIVSLGAGLRGGGFGGGGVLDAIYFFNTGKIFLYLGGAFGIEPISYFRSTSARTTNLSGGLIYNINSPSEWSGLGYSSSFPISFARILGRAFAGKNGAYGALMQLAKIENLGNYNHTLQFSNSSSGPAAIKVGSKSSTFSTDVGWLLDPIDINQLASEGGTYLSGVASQISSTATALKANFANSLKIFN